MFFYQYKRIGNNYSHEQVIFLNIFLKKIFSSLGTQIVLQSFRRKFFLNLVKYFSTINIFFFLNLIILQSFKTISS